MKADPQVCGHTPSPASTRVVAAAAAASTRGGGAEAASINYCDFRDSISQLSPVSSPEPQMIALFSLLLCRILVYRSSSMNSNQKSPRSVKDKYVVFSYLPIPDLHSCLLIFPREYNYFDSAQIGALHYVSFFTDPSAPCPYQMIGVVLSVLIVVS